MSDILTKLGVGGGGPNFKDPRLLMPFRFTATDLHVYDTGGVNRTFATTEAFTECANRGVQDTTNWSADTFKTILSVSGAGKMYGYIGCTSGGADDHTIEITVDGTVYTIVIPTTSGLRAALLPNYEANTFYTTSGVAVAYHSVLDSGKQYFDGVAGNVPSIPSLVAIEKMGYPVLQFDQSLLIRAKHESAVTNSTATAYSAVLYRKLLGSAA